MHLTTWYFTSEESCLLTNCYFEWNTKLKSSIITYIPFFHLLHLWDKAIFTLTLWNFLMFKICKVLHTLINLCLDIDCFPGVLVSNDVKSLFVIPHWNFKIWIRFAIFLFRSNQIIWVDLEYTSVICIFMFCLALHLTKGVRIAKILKWQ